jgi:hypothetical protein
MNNLLTYLRIEASDCTREVLLPDESIILDDVQHACGAVIDDVPDSYEEDGRILWVMKSPLTYKRTVATMETQTGSIFTFLHLPLQEYDSTPLPAWEEKYPDLAGRNPEREENYFTLAEALADPINTVSLTLPEHEATTLDHNIGRLRNLRCLNARLHNLGELPPEIGYLVNLEKLNLWDAGIMTLPPQFVNLTHLKELDLQGNPLGEIPLSLPRLGIITLNLSSTNLAALDVIRLPKTLVTLDVSMNDLSRLPDLSGFPNLREIIFGFNPLDLTQALETLRSSTVTVLSIDAPLPNDAILPPQIEEFSYSGESDFPQQILHIPNLKKLSLLCSLKDLPDDLQTRLPMLTSLSAVDLLTLPDLSLLPLHRISLYKCRFQKLPPVFPEGLAVMDLTSNLFETADAILPALPANLTELVLKDCPVAFLPEELDKIYAAMPHLDVITGDKKKSSDENRFTESCRKTLETRRTRQTQISGSSSVEELAAIIKNCEIWEALAAVNALGTLKDGAGKEALTAACMHDSISVRAEALRRVRDASILLPFLQSNMRLFRTAAAEGLSFCADQKCREMLLIYYDDTTNPAREYALEALGRAKGNGVFERCIEALPFKMGFSYKAVAALGWLGDERALDILEPLTRNAGWFTDAASALRAIAAIGGAKAVNILKKLAQCHPDGSMRGKSFAALLSMENKQGSAACAEIYEAEEDYSALLAMAKALAPIWVKEDDREKLRLLLRKGPGDAVVDFINDVALLREALTSSNQAVAVYAKLRLKDLGVNP